MDRSSEIRTQCEDGVHCYGIEFLSLSLIWHGFHDSIREGDGDRILRYWKFLLVIFKSSNKRNYAKEAVNLLLQYYYLFSDRQVMTQIYPTTTSHSSTLRHRCSYIHVDSNFSAL